MIRYSTEHVRPQAKVSHWNSTITSVFSPMEAMAVNPLEFEAEVRFKQLGPMAIANVVSRPATIHHYVSHAARSASRRFFVHTQLEGKLIAAQDGKSAELALGDMVVCDSSMPYHLKYHENCSTLVLIVSAQDLKRHVPTPEELLGVTFSGQHGLPSATSNLLRSLWTQVEEELDPDICARVANNVLDMLATAWMVTKGRNLGDSAVAESRRVQIRRYIESNLREAELSPQSVAAAFGISTRYLHMLLAEQDESVCSYILRRRLEECSKQLADPLWRKRTITEIAFNWGFNNATHFARVFRNQYQMSPRDFRHLGDGK